jgi:NADH-quinone oxidoreductase subunit G/NADP-reducing hydrogenase subunit HndD
MIEMQVDGRTIEAREGETILSALKRVGIHVPTLCYLEGLLPYGSCRTCVVEQEGSGTLLPSCSYPVAQGLRVLTRSPKVLNARKLIVELLLSNHPDGCLYCVRNSNCELRRLAETMGIRQHSLHGRKNHYDRDVAGPIIRDLNKCILCGRCVHICDEIQGVSCIGFIGRGSGKYIGTTFNQSLNVSTCVNCGQCIVHCPTGALTERSNVDEVISALADPDKIVIVQHAPAVSVSLAEEFGVPAGQNVDGKMVAALRLIGFKKVFDTSFSADLTIMEEASELAYRITNGGVLPMFTSCSPGWIKFVEQFYHDMIPNLSTCKSPQQMMGAIIKSYFAEREKIDPAKIVSVSIMPCTAKKFEHDRPEMGSRHIHDVDYVLTTRELGRLLKTFGIELMSLEPQTADYPFSEHSTAGKIFGASGGVMEAALRTAHFLVTGEEIAKLDILPVRGMAGIKEVRMKIGDLEIGAAVVSGLLNARKVLDEINAGRNDLQFIEVMTCPGGCINGGGQPLGLDPEAAKVRMQTLYKIDENAALRVSHKNPFVQRLYEEYLGKPLGEKSHHLLHTHYSARDVL